MRDDQVLHEGDWERVTVYLDEADPEGKPPSSVIYYRHSTNTTRKWASVEKDDETHPVVYCGIGSHASLPSPDFGYIDVGDRKGPALADVGPRERSRLGHGAAVVRLRRRLGQHRPRSGRDRAPWPGRALEAGSAATVELSSRPPSDTMLERH